MDIQEKTYCFEEYRDRHGGTDWTWAHTLAFVTKEISWMFYAMQDWDATIAYVCLMNVRTAREQNGLFNPPLRNSDYTSSASSCSVADSDAIQLTE